MKASQIVFRACLKLGFFSLAGIVLAGCSSTKYEDPINPSSPYVFPGQNPTAPPAGQSAPSPSPAPPAITNPGPPVGNQPAPARQPANDAQTASSILRAGDTLVISFSDLPPPGIPPITTELGSDGKITLPFNIIVQAIGKTTRQLEQEIRSEYVPKYYRYLTITVKTDLRFFHVAGEVKVPAAIPYRGDTTVLRAIGAAGGFTDFAKRSKVLLTRPDGKKYTIDADKALRDQSKDLPVYPGDYVYVPKRLW